MTSSAGWRIDFAQASRNFAAQQVLAPLDLRFEPGRINLLLGPNGAGKTTLLKLAAGLLSPSSGVVSINRVDLRNAGPGLRQRIGFAAHDSFLYPDLTGRENLQFAAAMAGVGAAVAQWYAGGRRGDRGALVDAAYDQISAAASLLEQPLPARPSHPS